MSRLNQTKAYWNQYFDITDLPETRKNEKFRTCNVCCVAMITGGHPDDVLGYMLLKYGINNKFQWEENLIKYLREKGYKCKKVTFLAWPRARKIWDSELKKMRAEIDKGNIIFYHKKGHYQLMIGYDNDDIFIFNDPAGDRNKSRKLRKRLSGYNVRYFYNKIKAEKIYGRCWSVEI